MRTIKKLVFYVTIIFFIAYGVAWCTNTAAESRVLLIAEDNSSNWDDSVYFNTEIIKNYEMIHKQLQVDGFQEKIFMTPDKYSMHALYLERPNATYNVIVCAGFYPGKKEGMASFYKLLPDDCNILFFDARGHGESDGSFVRSLLSYGTSEYNDIIGAIELINSYNNNPIILLGTCSGAFHAAHAVLYLTKIKKLESMHVVGLIFESGWGSATSIAATVPIARAHENLLFLLKKIYFSKRMPESNKHIIKDYVLDTVPFKILSSVATVSITLFHKIVYQWPFVWYEKSTNLFDKINDIPIPVFFVHSHDDTYASIHDVKKLACLTSSKTCWWIEQPSKHACHSLKHKIEYKKKLAHYLYNTLNVTPNEMKINKI